MQFAVHTSHKCNLSIQEMTQRPLFFDLYKLSFEFLSNLLVSTKSTLSLVQMTI